jgi:hypothetical protein
MKPKSHAKTKPAGTGWQVDANYLHQATGVVIPVYLPDRFDPVQGQAMIEETVLACLREIGNPGFVCLSADGPGRGRQVAARLARKHGVRAIHGAVNRGKLAAARLGVGKLLESRAVRYVAVIDQDGDHFANELLNFIRAARHVGEAEGRDRVMVLGSRRSRHRPMGFLRGELEELADRVLLDALHYRAAKTGRPLPMQFATSVEEFPDFHSGYKVFTRPAAEAVFAAEPRFCGVDDDCYYRHAVEAVMSVEALESGAILAAVSRSAFDEQPVTTFGLLNRQRLVADKIIWPCKRLEVPVEFADQWIRNHAPRLLLGSLAPQGYQELAEIRRLVLAAYGRKDGGGAEVFARARFV